MVKKLKRVGHGLKTWRRSNGKILKARIDMLKKDLRPAYKSPGFASEEVRCKDSELKLVLREEKAYWKL